MYINVNLTSILQKVCMVCSGKGKLWIRCVALVLGQVCGLVPPLSPMGPQASGGYEPNSQGHRASLISGLQQFIFTTHLFIN